MDPGSGRNPEINSVWFHSHSISHSIIPGSFPGGRFLLKVYNCLCVFVSAVLVFLAVQPPHCDDWGLLSLGHRLLTATASPAPEHRL